MKIEIYNLFVYGSLRSGFRNPVYEYLTKYFHLQGEAVVKGKLYDLGEYPVALPTDEDKFISGESLNFFRCSWSACKYKNFFLDAAQIFQYW